MPWSIHRQENKYCVVKDGTQEVEGCHDSRGEAVNQLRALNAAEADKTTNYASVVFNLDMVESIAGHLRLALDSVAIDEVKMHVREAQKVLGDLIEKKMERKEEKEEYPDYEIPGMPGFLAAGKKVEEYHWEGPIVFEGAVTGDNRVFLPGSIEWNSETLPWPFRWQKESTKGHDGAVPIGRVDHLERKEDGSIYGYGVIIPSLNEEAAEYLRLLESGVASGVSVDGDSAVFDVQEMATGESQVVFSSMRLRSLTAVDIPAFNEARVDLVDENDKKEELGGKPSQGTPADNRLAENKDDEAELAKNKKKRMGLKVRRLTPYSSNDVLTAAAIPVKPKTEWFQEPKLEGPTGITVTKEGRVFGHLALFDSCHIGFPGCVTPPKGSDYKYFHTGEIETETEDLVEVGHLTFNTGHASMSDHAKAAAAHYDHTGTVAADVRCGEDEFGIWVAGALRPSLNDEQIREFRAAPLSGDWRRIAGRLELVGALAVNVPGFPVPRARALVASGETETLITFSEDEFHLIGKHDQSSHGAGGAGSGPASYVQQRAGAAAETAKGRRESPNVKAYTTGAARRLTGTSSAYGSTKLKKLSKANLKNISDPDLKILHKQLQSDNRRWHLASNVTKIMAPLQMSSAVAAAAAAGTPPGAAIAGVIAGASAVAGYGRYKVKSGTVQANRIESELKSRGSSLSANLEIFAQFQIEGEDEAVSLKAEIAAARKELEAVAEKVLSGDFKADGKKASKADIEEIEKTIKGLEVDKEEGITAEFLKDLNSYVSALKTFK